MRNALRLRPAPRTSHPAPRTPHLAPRTSHPAPRTPHLAPRTPHLAPRTPHPAPRTPHPPPATLPRLAEIHVDRVTLAAALASTLVAALLANLAPIGRAARATGGEFGDRSGSASRRTRAAQRWIVGLEAALSVALVIVAILAAQSFLRLRATDLGFNPDRLTMFHLPLGRSRYAGGAERTAFLEQLLARLRAVPGVSRAGTIDAAPFEDDWQGTSFSIDGRPPFKAGEEPSINFAFVSPGYFETIGLPLVRGRTFTPTDRAGAEPVTIVNETFARRFFPEQDPVGRRVALGFNSNVSRRIDWRRGRTGRHRRHQPRRRRDARRHQPARARGVHRRRPRGPAHRGRRDLGSGPYGLKGGPSCGVEGSVGSRFKVQGSEPPYNSIVPAPRKPHGAIVVAAGALAATLGMRSPARMAADARGDRPDGPTFASDVAAIVYAHCIVCHRPGRPATFPLVSYDDVRAHGEAIVRATASHAMPPWRALSTDGFAPFRDETALTPKQLSTLARWVKDGMPAGDLSKAPRPPAFPSGWILGPPDLILSLPRPVDVPAEGPDLFRNVALPVELPGDRSIRAIDVEPSAPDALGQALLFIGPASADVPGDEVLPGLGEQLIGRSGPASAPTTRTERWEPLGGWIPGMLPRRLPDGLAWRLPRTATLVAQLRLHPSGRPASERVQIGLYFADAPPAASLVGVQVPPAFGFGLNLDIPAGDARHVVEDSFVLPVDVRVYGARGDAHDFCREMTLTAALPDGSTRGLLRVGSWDARWPDAYFYETPFLLPKGTTLHATIVYDNSAANPRNPHVPPARVRWGRTTADAMGGLTLIVAAPDRESEDALRQAQSAHLREQIVRRLVGR